MSLEPSRESQVISMRKVHNAIGKVLHTKSKVLDRIALNAFPR